MDYDIFRLDIPMDYSKGMYLIDCLADLSHDEGYPGL
jgi:hypothetical protein